MIPYGPRTFRLFLAAIAFANCGARFFSDRLAADERVELYGTFERLVSNDRTYSNPFDFREIELQTEFTAPSGRKLSFFGFHDGDGQGAQTGNVWSFRCFAEKAAEMQRSTARAALKCWRWK